MLGQVRIQTLTKYQIPSNRLRQSSCSKILMDSFVQQKVKALVKYGLSENLVKPKEID